MPPLARLFSVPPLQGGSIPSWVNIERRIALKRLMLGAAFDLVGVPRRLACRPPV
jgi:hypothetical protein